MTSSVSVPIVNRPGSRPLREKRHTVEALFKLLATSLRACDVHRVGTEVCEMRRLAFGVAIVGISIVLNSNPAAQSGWGFGGWQAVGSSGTPDDFARAALGAS